MFLGVTLKIIVQYVFSQSLVRKKTAFESLEEDLTLQLISSGYLQYLHVNTVYF